ncbi:MAG: hypothetical protein AVDCRST_MAG23-2773, partial [uncultured Sphingosinicella sp.]
AAVCDSAVVRRRPLGGAADRPRALPRSEKI